MQKGHAFRSAGGVINSNAMESLGICGLYSPQIRSKADLMKYCLETTARRTKLGHFINFRKDKAKQLYDFFMEHVQLPDVEPDIETDFFKTVYSSLDNQNRAPA